MKRASDYRRELTIASSPEAVYRAIATSRGIRGWWTALVAGSARVGGRVRLTFDGLDEHIDLHIVAANPPSLVEWRCLEHSSLDEWAGTTMRFAIEGAGRGRSRLSFMHVGLSPKLVCFDDCRAGWEHFLASLVAYVESGEGQPYVAQGA